MPDQWYRVFTAIFLSGGVVHFLLNMVFQYQTGFLMERDIGFIRIFFIYFISGVGGNLFGSLFSPLSGATLLPEKCLWRLTVYVQRLLARRARSLGCWRASGSTCCRTGSS